MKLTKGDLIFNTYDWPDYPEHDPRVSGVPDTTPFNRHEGPEVIHMIEEICALLHIMVKDSARSIEIQIHNELPSNVRSQVNVLNWVCTHQH
jgi:hypothetical protein